MMDVKDKRDILKDYQILQDQMKDMVEGRLPNFTIRSEDYVTPTISTHILPLEHERGNYEYFNRLRKNLEILLITGKLPKGTYVPRAPAQVSKYIEK